jgi:hypothetical protein
VPAQVLEQSGESKVKEENPVASAWFSGALVHVTITLVWVYARAFHCV